MAFVGDNLPGRAAIAGIEAIAAVVAATPTPLPYNSTAWAALKDSAKDSSVQAVLLEYDINGNEDKPAWEFLINPRSLRYTDSATYTPISPHASRVAHHHYSSASGATLTIPDLVFSTFCYGKSFRSLIEGARELMRCKALNNDFAPPLLLFKFGSLRFGPCLLSSLDWEDSAWLGGDEARTRLSLTLIETAKPETEAEKSAAASVRQQAEALTREAKNQPRVPLTPRQVERAEAIARAYLLQNQNEWSDSVQSLILSGFKVTADPKTGDVTMRSPSGETMGVVMRYVTEDNILSAGASTTVPMREGVAATAITAATVGGVR